MGKIISGIFFAILLTIAILSAMAGAEDRARNLAVHLANVICLAVTVICRYHNLRMVHRALDRAVREEYAGDDDPTHPKAEMCKVWLTLPSGQYCTVRGERACMNILLTEPKILGREQRQYDVRRWVCWAAFAGHAVTLGTTSLLYQLVCVIVMIGSTFVFIARPRYNESVVKSQLIGNQLKLEVTYHKPLAQKIGHIAVYLEMNLSTNEERMMRNWGVMFDESARGWWDQYYDKKRARNRITGNSSATPSQNPADTAQPEASTASQQVDSQSVEEPRTPETVTGRSLDQPQLSPRNRVCSEDGSNISQI